MIHSLRPNLNRSITTFYRYDRDDKGGGFLLYIRGDISSRLLQCKSECNIESLSVEMNLRKREWFLNCSYNTHRNSISRHLERLNRVIDEHSRTYDSFILIGNFNVGIDENSMKNFCDINCLKNLIKVPSCFKNPVKPTCIDLILTNRPNLFQHSNTFETGLFWRLYELSRETCFVQWLLERRHVPMLPFTRLWVRASLPCWDTLSHSIRWWNGLAQSCFKRGLVVSFTMTLSFYGTFLFDISYESLKVLWILGRDSWYGRKPWMDV